MEGTVLTPKDHEAFIRALDATEPTKDLVALMSRQAGTSELCVLLTGFPVHMER